jgi:type II secretory pathway component PulK
MENDLQELEQLNIRMGVEEDNANDAACEWFDSKLAPQLAFRRANGTFDNRDDFLKKVKSKSSDRRETEVISIDLHGNRAIVTCIVTMGDKRYHNLRLFVRHEEHEEQWKLLGWANEQI